MHYISEERFVLELPTSRAMLAIARPSCIFMYFCCSTCSAMALLHICPICANKILLIHLLIWGINLLTIGHDCVYTGYRADQMDRASEGVINLQYGSAAGATQAGMTMGGRRDIRGLTGTWPHCPAFTRWRHRTHGPISSVLRFSPEWCSIYRLSWS